MGDATVWAQALDGRWERLGADRARGVWPEGQRPSANDWGSDTASFLARRDPGAVHPDLSPATPIDIEIGGERVWGGYVWEPPQQADERAIAVECRGWQYHTDEDLVDRLYVHSRLEAWQDTRQSLATALTVWQASGFVEAAGGGLVFGWPANSQANAGQHVGVTLDLGRTEAKRVVVETETINGNAAFTFVIRGHDNGDPNPSAAEFTAGQAQDSPVAMESLGNGFRAFTFTNPHRYVTIFLYRDDAASGVVGTDHLVRLKQAMVFRDTAYESGNASVLKASQVVADLLQFCPLLDQRTDLIQTSDVVIPDFSLEDATPRQGMEQANAVQGWQLRATPERMLEYRPRPTAPMFAAGKWAGESAGLSGASRGSLEPIHNRVIVKGNDSSGRRVVVDRASAAAFGENYRDAGLTSVGSWSAPPAVVADSTSGSDADRPFRKGLPYSVRIVSASSSSAASFVARIGDFANGDFVAVAFSTPLGGATEFVTWRPTADRAAFGFELLLVSGNITSFTLNVEARRGVTMVDRRGRVRTRGIRVGRAITDAVGVEMADASLAEAARTAFKGDQTLYRGGLRLFLGGGSVHPGLLLRHTGELVHESHLVDPDNGNLGRDARVVAVTYEDEPGIAQATLDSTRTDFETQLARYEVTGGR